MSEHITSPEITFAPAHAADTKHIWKTFWLLSALTIIELGIGYYLYATHGGNPNHTYVLMFKGLICILTLAKAYYIVSIFMHLGSENKNFKMTIVVPLCLFIWFIIAFLWDGNSWKKLRNTDGGSHADRTEQVQTVQAHHE